MKVDINICTRDRATELYGLLISLMHQEHQDFDVYILDDASGTNMQQYHFIQCMMNRLRYDGHRVHIIRNEQSKGVCKARQKLADYTLKHGGGMAICRLDDDTVLPTDYLKKLISVLDAGYDMASGVTPPIMTPLMQRENRFAEPVINRIVLDDEGHYLVNTDDCGHTYLEEKIIPAHHFRSNCLIKTEIHKHVKYDDIIAADSGFREETFFSLRAILLGYKLGVHTGAVAWHLITPSGGERRPTFGNFALMNQQLLNRRTRAWFEEHGDFLTKYNDACGIKNEPRESQLRSQHKNNNLLFTTEE